MKQTITFEDASKAFSYDPESGEIVWLVKPNKNHPVGRKAGTNCNGYLVVRRNGQNIYCHRLAWLLHYGKHPDAHIDHINGNKSDNRIYNLRCVTNATNHENVRKARSHNSTGVLGVTKQGNRYVARIGVKGKYIHLGSFGNTDDASIAYISAKRLLHAGCTI